MIIIRRESSSHWYSASGEPCQAHAAKARRDRETRAFRLHPVIPCPRNIATIRSSVSLFPRPRIRDITSARLTVVKTSGTRRRKVVIVRGNTQPPIARP